MAPLREINLNYNLYSLIKFKNSNLLNEPAASDKFVVFYDIVTTNYISLYGLLILRYCITVDGPLDTTSAGILLSGHFSIFIICKF